MHSSTSSSRSRAPKKGYITIFLVVFVVATVLLFLAEWRIREAGFLPNVRDSKELWSAQRKRASELGEDALILVGNSRLQLGIDIAALRRSTNLEPVQLSIDGSSTLPVLMDLANDPSVTGTILLSTEANLLLPDSKRGRAQEWVEFYNDYFRDLYSPKLEAQLKSWVMEHSALYASAVPLTLYPEVFTGQRESTPLYLITKNNRERDADYNLVEMPLFYANRVLRTLAVSGQRLSVNNWAEFDEKVTKAINELTPYSNTNYMEEIAFNYALIHKIEERGAKVIFLRMPSDKLIWEIDKRIYPRSKFWDLFAADSSALTIHFKDYPSLSNFELPDGSHLDKRDKRSFSDNLGKILNQFVSTDP